MPDPAAAASAPVVILGGGLTGISTALHLGGDPGRGDPPWVLIEQDDRLGGHARTDERDGFRFDRTGHWLHLRDPYTQRLADDLLPGGFARVARRARVLSHGALTRYPFQANLGGLPPGVAAECLLGFIRAWRDPPAAQPRNFEEFCLRRFGEGIARHFMIPYNRKLWGVEPREITSEWCERFVPIPRLEDVVAGAVGAAPPEMGYNIHFLYPRDGGIERMTRALIARLDPRGEVRTSQSPDAIDWRTRRVSAGGRTLGYRALVSTIPLPELLARMDGLPPEVAEAQRALRCTPVRYLNVATRSSPRVDYHWLYVPEERHPFYRVGIYTNAVPSMAPPGRGGLYVELGGRGPARPADETLRDCLPGLREAGAVESADDVLFCEQRELRWAYVVFDDAYYAAVGLLRPWLERHAIYPRGRYGSWTYNSMEDCILAGRDTAALLQGAPP